MFYLVHLELSDTGFCLQSLRATIINLNFKIISHLKKKFSAIAQICFCSELFESKLVRKCLLPQILQRALQVGSLRCFCVIAFRLGLFGGRTTSDAASSLYPRRKCLVSVCSRMGTGITSSDHLTEDMSAKHSYENCVFLL